MYRVNKIIKWVKCMLKCYFCVPVFTKKKKYENHMEMG